MYGIITLYDGTFQNLPFHIQVLQRGPTTPKLHCYNSGLGFGLFPGRSPLLGESLLFSLPGGTKMFQFPPFASLLLQR